MNSYDLSGQHAVVTGGAQGLGFAMAKRFVESGAKVTLWDVNEALLSEAVSALGANARSVAVDITDYSAVEAAHREREERQGPVSILVNSAGIAGPAAPLDVYDVEPLPAADALRKEPRALLTPHIGYVTAETYKMFFPGIVEAIDAWLAGKPVRVIG